MDKRYFVITGMERSGTTFLANVINQHPDVVCVHEPFVWSSGRYRSGLEEWMWPRGFEKWRDLEVPIIGMSNHCARGYMQEIEEEVHPIWGCVWRYPLDVLRSYTPKDPLRYNHLLSPFLRKHGSVVFSELEGMLSVQAYLGLDVKHFSFARFTTDEGFRELAAHFDIDFEPGQADLSVGRNATPDARRLPHWETWDAATLSYISDLIASLPRLSKLYEGLELWPRATQ